MLALLLITQCISRQRSLPSVLSCTSSSLNWKDLLVEMTDCSPHFFHLELLIICARRVVLFPAVKLVFPLSFLLFAFLKKSRAPNIDIPRGGERCRYLAHVTSMSRHFGFYTLSTRSNLTETIVSCFSSLHFMEKPCYFYPLALASGHFQIFANSTTRNAWFL